ncbi:hypothetical protein ACXR0O_15565 [Verrucomicrobiota bacterium sgz303538]
MPIARHGEFLYAPDLGDEPMLGLESPSLERCVQEAAARQIPGVFGSSSFSFSESSLSFLDRLPHLRQIWFWDVALSDIDGVYSLPHLSFVHLHGTRPPIDFQRIPSIHTLSIGWHPKDSGIGTLHHATKFYFWHHKPRTKTFRGAEFPPNLQLLQINWSNVSDLDGLPRLPSVTHLEFHRCRNLRSLDGIDELFPNTEKLVITTCGRLEDISATQGLNNLRFISPDATAKARK